MKLRATKILATLGPACTDAAMLGAMLDAGLDGARLNLSHGEHAEHALRVRRLRREARSRGRTVAVVLDLQGAKIRTAGPVEGEAVHLVAGSSIVLVGRAVTATPERLGIGLRAFARRVHRGDRVLVDDGKIQLRVARIRGDNVFCDVEVGGRLVQRRGVSLPDTPLDLPALTAKDRADLDFGVRLGVDFVAQSFVGRAADVRALRRELARRSRVVPIIAKLERRLALENLDEILAAAEGVMVARGDLGVEIPVERVPAEQKRILARAGERGRLTITATQMLETMIQSPQPTRAEVSDVANAVFDGTDVLMLSAETATGHDPAAAVAMMHRIALGAETPLRPTRWSMQHDATRAFTSVLAEGARRAASRLGARALVVVTRSGRSALVVSKHRPNQPIFAVSASARSMRRTALFFGVVPFPHRFVPDADDLHVALEAALRSAGHVARGDTVAMLAGWHGGAGAVNDLLRLSRVGGGSRSRRGSRH